MDQELFQIQAAIATLHGLAPTFDATDWPQIAMLYGLLQRLQPTPVVAVNRAAAVSFADGPMAGLAVLASLTAEQFAEVERWHLYWSTKADLLRQLDRRDAAANAYRQALGCPLNETDARFLRRRLEQVTA